MSDKLREAAERTANELMLKICPHIKHAGVPDTPQTFCRMCITEAIVAALAGAASVGPGSDEQVRKWIELWADKKLGVGCRPCGWPSFGSIAVNEVVEMLCEFALERALGATSMPAGESD